MFGLGKTASHREITSTALQAMLAADEVMLVDVREPNEFAAEHIAGAINRPLSTFDAGALPSAGGKTIILQCAGGKRSGMALDRCAAANGAIDTHLGGGLSAWKSAGLPTVKGG
jgi:rhodanese-related sulfurtransferase